VLVLVKPAREVDGGKERHREMCSAFGSEKCVNLQQRNRVHAMASAVWKISDYNWTKSPPRVPGDPANGTTVAIGAKDSSRTQNSERCSLATCGPVSVSVPSSSFL
jgi:hypothetical protein